MMVVPSLAQAEEKTSPPPCHAQPPALTPPGAQVILGGREHHRPLLSYDLGPPCMRLELPLGVAARGEAVTAFDLDRDDEPLAAKAFGTPRIRVGARFDSGRAWLPVNLALEYEHDLLTGAFGFDPELRGEGFAGAEALEHQLRKAYARVSIARAAHLQLGWMTSHWGMGLLANDGDHGWQPGSAYFSDPRGGDRMLRAQLATGPHTSYGLLAAVGGDIVDGDWLADDDVLLEGDRAMQIVAATMIGRGKPHGAGVYAVFRRQKSRDDAVTDVMVLDATARSSFRTGGVKVSLATEAALIMGTTELAPTPEYPEHEVMQFGVAGRAAVDYKAFGAVLDVLYASGDRNLDDEQQNGFKADPNYEMGLLLFRQVLADQSARGTYTAGDPTLVGVPAQDLERIATRGSATNTLALFPRLRVRPVAGLEAYTGLLFAFAATTPVDPFNTRIAGGVPHNALGGKSGSYLGTEADGGVRYRVNLAGAEVTVGVEVGALRPGSAFRKRDGTTLGAVYGSRMMLDARL